MQNNQDYEQKKQQCWLDFRKEHPGISCKSFLRNFVSFIFDRAYALGKQKETITQEEIEKAAEKYSQRLGKNRDMTWSDAENGFIAGANFAIGKQEIRPFTEEEIDEVIQEHINRLLDGHRFDDELRANLSFEIMYYFRDAINKILGKQENDADTVIQGWVARDKEGDIFMYEHQPKRIYDGEYSRWEEDVVCNQPLPCELFPDLTWDDDPIEVEIIIKRKKNG